jgi:hypothetical protein
MGIDAQIVSEPGDILVQLTDPKGYVNWLISFALPEATVCLRFIDPYGITQFNCLQIPLLQQELESLVGELTESNLSAAKADYLERAAGWPANARDDAKTAMESISLTDLDDHLRKLITLLVDAQIHHSPRPYVRFNGD